MEKNKNQAKGITLMISFCTQFSHEIQHNFAILAIALIAICLQRADALRIPQTYCSFHVEFLLV
jgi:hypothetical protein